jgi:hypothetical protein
MSRATRPLRRVRGADRLHLALAMIDLLGGAPAVGHRLERAARLVGCRPSHLRRCLIGRVVSARAASRILASLPERTAA